MFGGSIIRFTEHFTLENNDDVLATNIGLRGKIFVNFGSMQIVEVVVLLLQILEVIVLVVQI